MYQVFVPGIFFSENFKRSFENVPGFRYQVGKSTRLKVPVTGTFLLNLVKKTYVKQLDISYTKGVLFFTPLSFPGFKFIVNFQYVTWNTQDTARTQQLEQQYQQITQGTARSEQFEQQYQHVTQHTARAQQFEQQYHQTDQLLLNLQRSNPVGRYHQYTTRYLTCET